MDDFRENVLEFVNNSKTATVTFGQGRYITKIRKLSRERPEECQIVHENRDGTIVAHIPVKWIKITPTRIMTEEQREKLKERAKNLWS